MISQQFIVNSEELKINPFEGLLFVIQSPGNYSLFAAV